MRDAASMVGEDLGDTSRSNANEERIFVSIRVRPLNEKERARHDVSEWECISSNTIKFKNSLAERPSSMDAYTFDRVFGDGCSTQQVYEEGIKEVAISVVSGINSSIFAYGQTSSGKTYTMTGITEYAVRDIYDYIEMHKEREFVLKFSAMEIYNEAVRDLLSADSGPLRLLDDPEKGTVIEKLTEETLTEWSDLQKLLSICAAERTTEETSMNESSSRSHQILRLTVESSPSDYVGTESSGTLVASVNFVDLAGSERASQALTAGARLREGSHINRSLLTLGTVIRKLSKERNGHIPYRESKLTRILHNSLGGNARTAIICTISPARSHVEQSRNTLFFAGCAKQVTTNAQVNVVMSDKVLVKQLQKELARMENELRNFAPSTILLKERELLIKQMDEEIKELTRQRDIFQSHVENLLQSGGKDKLLRVDKDSTSELSGVANNLRPDKDLRSGSPSEIPDRPISSVSFSNECHLQKHENPEDKFRLDGNIPKFVGPDPHQGSDETAGRADAESENNCKEVRCIEVGVKTDHQTDVNALKLKDLRSGSPSENPDRPISSVSFYNEHHLLQHENPEDKFHLDGNTPKFDGADPHQVWDETTDRADAESENNCKEVRCIEVEGVKTDHQTDVNASFPASEEREGKSAIRLVKKGDVGSSLRKGENELSHVAINNSPDALQQKIQELQGTIDRLVGLSESSESHLARTRSVRFTRSRSCRPILAATFPPEFNKVDQETIPRAQVDKLERKIKLPLQFDKLEQKTVSPSPLNNLDQKPEPPPQLDKPKALPCQLDKLEQEAKGSPARVVEKDNSTSLVRLQDKPSESKFHAKKRKSSRNHSRTHEMDASGDMESIMDSDTEDTASVLNFVVRMNARAKATPLKEDFDDLMVLAKTSGTNDRKDNAKGVNFHGLPSALLPSKFERQQREIIELWHARNVPLVHRSSFFLLSKGELPDSVYLNEELRRLSFLKDTFSSGTKFVGEDGQNFTPDSSMKALDRERKMLSKQVHKKFSTKEREELYLKWCIDLKTKHRSIQLAWRLWTNTKDMDHVRESAALVAKLVGLGQSDEAPKKTFGLGFFARRKSRKYQIWKDTMSTLT